MFKKLGETTHDFLQVLIKEFKLSRTKNGIRIEIELNNEMDSLRESEEKDHVRELCQDEKAGGKVIEKLASFFDDKDVLSRRIDCEKYPFRYANGGVLPIIKIEDKNYFCLFYRCIDPIGWNIANGASNNLDDLVFPKRIIYREFIEELIIIDDRNKNGKKIRYALDHNKKSTLSGTRNEALKAWENELGKDFPRYKSTPMPIKWIDGPDSIIIDKDNNKYSDSGFFINITPEDNAIEIDRIAIINLPDNDANKSTATLIDGEIEKFIPKQNSNGKTESGNRKFLINRIIGLFEVESFLEQLKSENKEFKPDRMFYNGEEKPKDEFEDTLNKYFERHNREPAFRTGEQNSIYEALKDKFDLCPITRSIASKFETWENLQEKINPKDEDKIFENNFDVFISFKSEDEDIANLLYEYLLSNGRHSFFSPVSIPDIGETDYARVIEKALDQCNYMIVVSSKAEYLDTGWVYFEWSSFKNEVRSGRKPNGQILTLTENVPVDDMPYGLRKDQNIPFHKGRLNHSYQKIEKFLNI